MYNEDKVRFGDPADSGRTTSEIRELENWQVMLQTHAKNVEPSKVKNLKRKNPLSWRNCIVTRTTNGYVWFLSFYLLIQYHDILRHQPCFCQWEWLIVYNKLDQIGAGRCRCVQDMFKPPKMSCECHGARKLGGSGPLLRMAGMSPIFYWFYLHTYVIYILWHFLYFLPFTLNLKHFRTQYHIKLH